MCVQKHLDFFVFFFVTLCHFKFHIYGKKVIVLKILKMCESALVLFPYLMKCDLNVL